MLHQPHPKAPGLAAGIDEPLIAELVDRFYARVRQDELIGPVFEARVEDWDEHLAKLRAFWSSVVLMTGRYKGQPMPVHAAIGEITDAHFERWLSLFADTAKTVCPPEAAALFIDRSQRIAQSLRLGIAASRGIIA
jgi:hemoglobin